MERCQSAVGLYKVIEQMREKGRRQEMCRVKIDVSFLSVWEIGEMAMKWRGVTGVVLKQLLILWMTTFWVICRVLRRPLIWGEVE